MGVVDVDVDGPPAARGVGGGQRAAAHGRVVLGGCVDEHQAPVDVERHDGPPVAVAEHLDAAQGAGGPARGRQEGPDLGLQPGVHRARRRVLAVDGSVPALVTQRLELGHKGLPERTVAPEGELTRQRLDAAQGAEDVRVARPRPADEHAPPRPRHLVVLLRAKRASH